jgi:hypothetical protein
MPVFAGATPAEQLQNGRAQARAIILKYVPNFSFDVAQARDVVSKVGVWVQRNQSDLSSIMESSQTSLPAALQLMMGNNHQVQQWIVANYTIAAAGMGPWESGKVMQLVADPSSEVAEGWAYRDLQDRLRSFGLIVKMENDGELQKIFAPPAATNGFGIATGVLVAIVIIAVGIAAVIAGYFYLSKRLELSNKTMSELCNKAQAEGDTATVQKCIEATKELQMGDPASTFVNEAGRVALLVGGMYVGVRYLIPWAFEQMRGDDAKPLRTR